MSGVARGAPRGDGISAGPGYPLSKRVFDLAIAVPAFILLSPVMLATGVLVRFALGSPVLFRQERPGLNATIFTLVKFRTMQDVPDEQAEDRGDHRRMTGIGRILRELSLDELPTLWNVLRGDMSLVGPRPLLPEYLPLYTARQMLRHDVPPGITGWAQINGRNAIDWETKFEHDLWYVENRSMLLDLKILLLSVAKVAAREGVSKEGRATTDFFQGSPPRREDLQ